MQVGNTTNYQGSGANGSYSGTTQRYMDLVSLDIYYSNGGRSSSQTNVYGNTSQTTWSGSNGGYATSTTTQFGNGASYTTGSSNSGSTWSTSTPPSYSTTLPSLPSLPSLPRR